MKRNSADLSDDGDSDISPPVVFTLKDLSLRKNLMRFKKSEKNTEYISKLHIYNFFSVLYANVYPPVVSPFIVTVLKGGYVRIPL